MIKTIQIKGFQSHKDTTLELTSGVNIILGNTNVGKSAIIRSLRWLVLNRPAGDSFVNAEAPLCSVKVTTDKGSVERQRKPKNSYIVNKTEFTAIGRSVPEEMKSVLHLNEINFERQFDPPFLIMQTPGIISKYISEVFGFDVIDRASTLAKARADKVRNEADELEGRRKAQIERLRALDGLDTVDEQVRVAEKTQNTINRVVQDMTTVCKLKELIEQENAFIETIQEVITDIHFDSTLKFLTEVESLDMKIQTLHDFSTQITTSIQVIRQSQEVVKAYETQLIVTENELVKLFEAVDVCPLCYSDIDENRVQEITSRL